jgi:hypothetical protein
MAGACLLVAEAEAAAAEDLALGRVAAAGKHGNSVAS